MSFVLILILFVVDEQKQELQEAKQQLEALEANLQDLQKKREVDNRALEVRIEEGRAGGYSRLSRL